MKSQMILGIIFFFIFSLTSVAQKIYEKDDIKWAQTIYWFGVDLSKARLIEGFNHAYEIQQNYFAGWNVFLLSKDVKLAILLGKEEVIPDLTIVDQRNKNRESYYYYNINADTVQSVIQQYSYPHDQGIGVVLIVDNFDKPSEKAYAWLTYFDLNSKKVLSTELIMGKTRMGGMVTHWGEALKSIIKEGAIY